MTNVHFKIDMQILFNRFKMNAFCRPVRCYLRLFSQFLHFLTIRKFKMHPIWPPKLVLFWCSDSAFSKVVYVVTVEGGAGLYPNLAWIIAVKAQLTTKSHDCAISGDRTHGGQPSRSRNPIVTVRTHEAKISFGTWNHLPETRLHETCIQLPACPLGGSQLCPGFQWIPQSPPEEPEIHHSSLWWREEWHNPNLINMFSEPLPCTPGTVRSPNTRDTWGTVTAKRRQGGMATTRPVGSRRDPGQERPVGIEDLCPQQNLHVNVYSCFILNCQDMGATRCLSRVKR